MRSEAPFNLTIAEEEDKMDNLACSERPPGYELFFAPLQVALDPNELERVQFAYIASKFGHARQVRENGARYFDHPKAAAWIYISELGGRDPRVIIDLLLHDLSEDTYLLSPYRISLNFGPEIALDVGALTKLPKGKETTEEYLQRIIERGPWSVLAKICDRLHNLRTVHTCTAEKRKKQHEETNAYHKPVLLSALRDYGGEWIPYAEYLEAELEKVLESVSFE